MPNNNQEWLKRCFNCMEPVDTPDAKCKSCGWDNHDRENGDAALEQTILKDQYILGKCLGRGGFGITYVGFDIALERRVAIKEYFPVGTAYRFSDGVTIRAYTKSEEDYQSGLNQALQESRTIAKLGQIPNVMQVYNVFLENGTVYMVMEYIDGISLADEVKQNGKLNWKDALHKLYPIMDALEKIHAKGMIHRDISPENIIRRNETGEPVLLDFGSARQPKEGLTVMLKPGYAPAEQYSRNGAQDGRVDEYALCATMYYLLTGNAPASADLRMFAKKELKRPSEYADDIPVEIEKVLLKGMALKSSDRYPSMKELHQAFLKAEQDAGKARRPVKPSSPKPPKPSKPEPGPENREKNGLLKRVAGTAITAAVGFLACFLLFGNAGHDRNAENEAAVSSAQESAEESGGNEAVDTEKDEMSTPVLTATKTPAPQPTAANTPTPEPTATNTPTPEPTATNTPTPQPTATNTPTPKPTATNTPTPEPTATNTPTPEPTATNTPTPQPTATNTPTPRPTATPVPAGPPRMKSDSSSYVFGSKILRSEITQVKIRNSLKNAPSTAWDVSEAGDGSVLAWVTKASVGKTLTIAGEGGVSAPEDSSLLFEYYFNLRKADLNRLDTSNVRNMSWMFHSCRSLTSLDLSSFDTHNVTNMHAMFSECRSLTSLDLSSFDTHNVTDMKYMFSNCQSLTGPDFSSFDTHNVTDMSYMFFDCHSLTSLDLSSFDTRNVKDMRKMFAFCKALKSIDTSNFDTSKANTSWMFFGTVRDN